MAEPIITIQGLTKRYDDLTAVDDLTLSIRRGEIFGLLGPNGAGKTTTTLMLLGLSEPSGGQALVDGIDCTRNPLKVKQMVGYLPDNVGFYPDLTGRENMRLTGRMNGLSGSELEDRIGRLLERTGMTEAADRKAGTYSKGMKQRLGIADILVKDPEVLILDEPTNGIDPKGMKELMTLIRELAEQDGKTILISSHQLHQIQQICDRVGIFVKGKLIACGKINELGEQMEGLHGESYELKTDPSDEKTAKLIRETEGVVALEMAASPWLIHAPQEVITALIGKLVNNGIRVLHLRGRGGDLDMIYEQYFEEAGERNASKSAGSKSGKKKRKHA